MREICIDNRRIGPGQPCYIIAEAGVNHNGDFDKALRLVDIAANAGADAVKFQTFIAENVVSPGAPKAEYQKAAVKQDESQLEMVKKYELSFEEFISINDYCKKKEILFLSTPFDFQSADFLVGLKIQAIKVASGEITNFPFLAHLASQGIPLVISTGMANFEEVEKAVKIVEDSGNFDYCLLHCVSSYPAAPEDVNLRAMDTLRSAFDVPVGFSDHTLGIEVPIAAVALGANIIEKHFTLDHELPGPDHRASLEPDELIKMVTGIRKVESAIGNGVKQPVKSEIEIASVARKSLVAAMDLKKGTILEVDNISIKRPGTGLPPSSLDLILGRRVIEDIKMGTLISMDSIE